MKHPQIVLGILSFLVLLSGMEGGWESAHQADIPNKPEQLYPEVGVFRKLDGIETGYGLTLYAGEYFEIIKPDGQKISGTLDVNGFARRWVKEPGNCQITFPRLDQSEWQPA